MTCMANEIQRCLLMMTENEAYSESWLLRQGKLTIHELNESVANRYLICIEQKTNDFMSENRYMLTEKGKKFAWNGKEEENRE